MTVHYHMIVVSPCSVDDTNSVCGAWCGVFLINK